MSYEGPNYRDTLIDELLLNCLKYLRKSSSLDELEDWVLIHLQQFLDHYGSEWQDLAYEILGLCVDLREGVLNESQLREELENAIPKDHPDKYLGSSPLHNEDVTWILEPV